MPNTIRIKRSATSTNTPASLAQGELAYSEAGTPNGIGQLFIGAAAASIDTICTAGAAPVQTYSIATMVATDHIAFDNAGVQSRALISTIPLSLFNNDLGTGGTVTSVSGGAGIGVVNGGTTPVVSLDVQGLAIGTPVATDDLIFHNGTTALKADIGALDLGLMNNSSGWQANDADTVLTTSAGSVTWTWIDGNTNLGVSDAVVPTQAAVKSYVDAAVSSAITFAGGYNAATNTPDLDTAPTGVTQGAMYKVTAAGTFFTEAVQIGDVLIADQANPTLLSHWTVVQDNIGAASETASGYIELATQVETDAGSDNARAITPLKLANAVIDGGVF